MQGSRRRSTSAEFGGAAPETRAGGTSIRARYALALGILGAALLLVSDAIAAERQRSAESVAACIVSFEDLMPGCYYFDLSHAPLAAGALTQGLRIPWWLVVSLSVAIFAYGAWYVIARWRMQKEDSSQRYRRPRAARVPARIVAKRQAIAAALKVAPASARNTALTVRQVMTEAIVIAPPSTSRQTLVNLLASAPLRHLLICEHGGRLLGIVTDRDLRHRIGKRAVDLMTRGPICVPSGALLGPATALMVDHQISCLPVIDEGRVRGVLTADDIALALECVLQAHEAPARQPAAADETVVLAAVQNLCDTVRVSESPVRPAPIVTSDLPPQELTTTSS
ncbi:MAG TPA: CBS domain-containing protein [Pirellulales bacterium]|jgi:acetoin utilization protein AcuB